LRAEAEAVRNKAEAVRTEAEAVRTEAAAMAATAERMRAEADSMRERLERSAQAMVAELTARAQEIDDRASAHLRALEHDRASLPDEVRKAIAGVLPGMVADAVLLDLASRPLDPPAGAGEAGGPRLRAEHDPIVHARQRSVEKRLDALTRRDQEIDDRISTQLRLNDEDRAGLAELVRRQDQLERSLVDADPIGRHDRLVAWINDVVPARVGAAVEATLAAQRAGLSASIEQAERARADAEAMSRDVQESSERIMRGLLRRDHEADERAAVQLGILNEERAALAQLLETGRDEVARSVIAVLPAMVEDAIRTAMVRYATERRAPLQELADRLRADSGVMRESLQRSFEKMMESLAAREQEMEDRAAAHVRSVAHEKSELGELRSQLTVSLTETVAAAVAEAVRAAGEDRRAEMDAAREELERLRAENEVATAELREAVAEMRAELARGQDSVERQAAASERAIEGLRSALTRPVSSANGRSSRAPDGPPPATDEPAETVDADAPAAPEVTVVDETDGGMVVYGKSVVPRARRVERRMLKIDDRDDASWRPLDRRQAKLSELLDRPDR
jgi:hypothetical protein